MTGPQIGSRPGGAKPVKRSKLATAVKRGGFVGAGVLVGVLLTHPDCLGGGREVQRVEVPGDCTKATPAKAPTTPEKVEVQRACADDNMCAEIPVKQIGLLCEDLIPQQGENITWNAWVKTADSESKLLLYTETRGGERKLVLPEEGSQDFPHLYWTCPGDMHNTPRRESDDPEPVVVTPPAPVKVSPPPEPPPAPVQEKVGRCESARMETIRGVVTGTLKRLVGRNREAVSRDTVRFSGRDTGGGRLTGTCGSCGVPQSEIDAALKRISVTSTGKACTWNQRVSKTR